jgi:diadenosine tetraphosphate (Ap4A) HIT family hydrolase
MAYDSGNIFARILRGEIPCKKVYEDDHVLAFYDIAPKAPVHVLVIPRGAYVSHDDFAAKATEAEIVGLTRAAGKIARDLGLAAPGYRLIANTGANGGQEVPHYHVHILGGAYVGPMVNRR